MFKKILTIIIGILAVPVMVFAINITVPSAPSSGYMLISTSTGAYVASSTLLGAYAKLDTTNQPFTGSLNLSSTTATSSEYRITNDGGNYARFTRASSSNQANLYNQVEVNAADGSGGTITHSGGYTIHTFTTTGTSTFTPPAGISNVEVLIVAGGGPGGYLGLGGGGGAGGLLASSSFPVTIGSNTVVVGAGGAIASTTGGYSLINSTVALGGGRGAYENGAVAAVAGGSGGGGVYTNQPGAAGTAGQGYAGGADAGGNPPYAGGGGGSSGVGPAQVGTTGGNGGPGTSSSISGSAVTYACGGGAGGYAPAGGAAGTGGCASAGNGNAASNGAGSAATANSGSGGGGGAGGGSGTGGAGGSGIVIIRYIPTTTTAESNLIQSVDSATGGIAGINTFSDNLADTHLTGSTVSLDIAGSVQAFLSALGYFGIGTTTPATVLSVVGTSTLNNVIPGGPYTGNMSTYSLGASTTRWSSLWAQNVNIGTSTWSLAQQGTRLGIFNQADGGGTEAVSVLSTGNVGIGTTAPLEKLQVGLAVSADGTARKALIFGIGGYADPAAFNTNSNGDKLIFYNGNGIDGRFGIGGAGDTWFKSLTTVTANRGYGSLNFYTDQNAGTPTPKIRLSVSGQGDIGIGGTITSVSNFTGATMSVISGSVGIGVGNTSPASKLEVVGTTTSTGIKITSLLNSLLAVDSTGNVIATTSSFMTYSYASSTFMPILDIVLNYVPYSGANSDLDLGAHGLTTGDIFRITDVSDPESTYADFSVNGSGQLIIEPTGGLTDFGGTTVRASSFEATSNFGVFNGATFDFYADTGSTPIGVFGANAVGVYRFNYPGTGDLFLDITNISTDRTFTVIDQNGIIPVSTTQGVTDSGTSCTVEAIENGIITAATCI